MGIALTVALISCQDKGHSFYSLYTIESISELQETDDAQKEGNAEEGIYVFRFDGERYEEKIGISRTRPEQETVLPTYGYYYVGVNLGEFDGWVARAAYESYLSDEHPEIVLRESFLGFATNDATSDQYLVTGMPYEGMAYGKVYHVKQVDGGPEEALVLIYESDDCPDGFSVDENGVLYLVTGGTLLSVTRDGKTRVLYTSEWLEEKNPTSLTVLHNTVYIGIHGGVAVYDIEQDSLMWYEITLA